MLTYFSHNKSKFFDLRVIFTLKDSRSRKMGDQMHELLKTIQTDEFRKGLYKVMEELHYFLDETVK